MPENINLSSNHSFITVVSGLPRSGTSMMMQMLEAGGMSILTDHIRTLDESNPKGYYEFEPVKNLHQGDHAWLEGAQGKAVKIISALIEYLPTGYGYKVIFMIRKLSEVLASQRAMLIQRGETNDQVSDEVMANLYQKHLEKVSNWILKQPGFDVLFITYSDIFHEPDHHAKRIAEFLCLELDTNRMVSVIDNNLYRWRQ